ncbi:expressed unknown protein [Seminavis robusta]|uniref:Inward rectifier potassium channel C-terminal domain-containing protein n=1 Tax=Seminavis robusta TaxID=568900 RepID=A0A9N8H7F6_9STRA|nr:expressed unknown protein [Seminavis robusta]|eukprot:Sro67_g037550.1 n/a (821) ;mRNA; f:55034-57816
MDEDDKGAKEEETMQPGEEPTGTASSLLTGGSQDAAFADDDGKLKAGTEEPTITASSTLQGGFQNAAISDDNDNLKKEVSFKENVHVASIPPIPVGAKEGAAVPLTEEPLTKLEEPMVKVEEDENRGGHNIATSFSVEEKIKEGAENPRSMAYLYKDGLEKPIKERAFASANLVRSRKRVDIETGACTRREVSAQPVWDCKDPMDPVERKVKLGQAIAKFEDGDDNTEDDDVPQYRMSAKNIEKSRWGQRKEFSLVSWYLQWTFRASFIEIIITDFIAFMVISLLWTVAIYLGALESPRCFVVAGSSLEEFPEWREHFYFMDAFQLSWTTFSTVGYGIVYPQVNKGSIDARPDCFVFSFMVTLESFVGVLFAAFCGSIIFGKIARIQSIAQISWSSPMVIRYGKGVVEPKPGEKKDGADEEDDDDSDSDEEDDKDDKNNPEPPGKEGQDHKMDQSSKSNANQKVVKYPPPIIEFRVINMLNYQKGGEIMNATLNVVASTEASKSMESLQLTEKRQETLSAASLLRLSKEITKKSAQTTAAVLRKTKGVVTQKTGKAVLNASGAAKNKLSGTFVQRVNRAIATPSSTMVPVGPGATMSDVTSLETLSETSEFEPFSQAEAQAEELKNQLAMAGLAATGQSTKHMVMDSGSGLVPIRIFSKLDIETDTHPFFKRVWNVRHVLNGESPLLSATAKRIILKHNGKWPEEICNPEFIRKHIHFRQIIVSLSGTQNSSGSAVIGMHVYEFKSLNIGYRFAQMLDVTDDGNLYLDEELLNDVHEQRGGGGEELRGFLVDEFGQEIENDEEEDEEDEKIDGVIPAKIM